MKVIKKSIVFLLVLASVLTFSVLFSACKNGGTEKNDVIFIVSDETFKSTVQKNGNGKISAADIDALKNGEVTEINEDKRYHAFICLSNDSFEKGRLSISGDVSFMSGITLSTDPALSARYINSENTFYIERSDDFVEEKAYFSVEFMVSKDYSGKALSVKLDYTSDRDGDSFESSAKSEKQIRILHKADTVSSIGYLNEEDYESGEYEDKIRDSLELAIGEKGYVVFDFKLSDEALVKETDMASVEIVAMPEAILDYTLEVESLPTSVYENKRGCITASFGVYDSVGDGRTLRFIVAVTAESAGKIRLNASISGSGIFFVGGYKVAGSVEINADLQRESRLEYLLSEGGDYYIVTGTGKETGDVITVPAVHKGIAVKEIDTFAFIESNHIKKVYLSSGLEKIGDSAFKGCSGLISIVIPASVTYVGSEAFAECQAELCCAAPSKPSGWSADWADNGASITWSSEDRYTLNSDGKSYTYSFVGEAEESVTVLKEYKYLPVTAIADNAFYEAEGLKSVTLPSGIKTVGEKAFYKCTALKSIVIPESVEAIGMSAFEECCEINSVTFGNNSMLRVIGESAFKNCIALYQIIIPKNTETIGNSAFEKCSELNIVSFSGDSALKTVGSMAFSHCTELTAINLPASLLTIGESAFSSCSNLKKLTFDDNSSLAVIGDNAFYMCSYLEDFTLPDSVTLIGKRAFEQCVTVENIKISAESELKKIDENAFTNCTSLITVVIECPLDSIEQGAFLSCINLQSVKLNAVNIQSNAFYNCAGLLEVELGNRLETIGNSVFQSCSSLAEIVLPNSVKSLGEYVFMFCDSLVSAALSNSITEIKYGLFFGCQKLSSIVIPESVTTVGTDAFYDCIELSDVTFSGSNVTKIDEEAFYRCEKLQNIVLPDSVKRIEDGAFSYCTLLESITLGKNVEIIRYHAFYNCSSLENINYTGTEQEWGAISKGNDWDLNAGEYTVTYEYSEK